MLRSDVSNIHQLVHVATVPLISLHISIIVSWWLVHTGPKQPTVPSCAIFWYLLRSIAFFLQWQGMHASLCLRLLTRRFGKVSVIWAKDHVCNKNQQNITSFRMFSQTFTISHQLIAYCNLILFDSCFSGRSWGQRSCNCSARPVGGQKGPIHIKGPDFSMAWKLGHRFWGHGDPPEVPLGRWWEQD